MQITIDEIMSTKIEAIEESASVQEVALKTRDKNKSSMIVVDSFDKPKGLVTERDLVRKICTKDISPTEIRVKDIMSLPIITITPSETLSSAIDIMLQHNIRHLLVVDDKTEMNKPLGMATPKD